MTHTQARVAIVMDHPAQHFASGLALLSGQPGLRVQVYYWTTGAIAHDAEFDQPISWDVDLLGGYAYAQPGHENFLSRVRWLVSELRRMKPAVLICYGWAAPIARVSIVYAALTGTRLVIYGDTTWQHSSGGRSGFIRAALLRILMRTAAGAVSTGVFNREFYIQHGMDPRRVWPGVCPADTEVFANARENAVVASPAADRSLRIGFAGKVIARKGLDELINAAALLPQNEAWSVTVVGDGPLLPAMKAMAAQLGLGDRVSFRGFANASEMPDLLAHFDVVVVPSRLDMRVLVTIEAMAAGAAVIVSDATAVWGPGDLVEDGETGLVYPSGDPAALAAHLHRLIDDPGLLAALRRNGAARSARFGPESFAVTMASAIHQCIGAESVGQPTEGGAQATDEPPPQSRASATTGP